MGLHLWVSRMSVQVKSSNVATVDWRLDDEHLLITFKDGSQYDYGPTTGDIVARLVFAPSVGRAVLSLGKRRRL